MTDATGTFEDAFYRYLFEHTGVVFIAVDTDLTIRSWNAAAARLFGSVPGEMIGSPIGSVVPEESRQAAQRMFRRAIERGEISDLEFQYKDEQNTRRELVVTISPIISESGVRIGASACVRDVTRRSTLQTQLSESRKMASLGHMAGAMAHHFNNILGGIVTSVDYANASNNPAIKSRILKMVSEALGRATTLLKGLLSFAEGETNAQDLSDYTEVVSTLADEIEPLVRRQNIELIVDMPEALFLPVPCVQVTTALRNIVQNAIDAMPDGGTLRLVMTVDKRWITTKVTDTGCGLDGEALSRVFEPFWSTRDVLDGGTEQRPGLGLAVAHGIIQVLGGSITVSSEPGKGSCFVLAPPRKDWEQES